MLLTKFGTLIHLVLAGGVLMRLPAWASDSNGRAFWVIPLLTGCCRACHASPPHNSSSGFVEILGPKWTQDRPNLRSLGFSLGLIRVRLNKSHDPSSTVSAVAHEPFEPLGCSDLRNAGPEP